MIKSEESIVMRVHTVGTERLEEDIGFVVDLNLQRAF